MTRDESDRSGPKELDAEDGDQAKTVDFSVVVPVFNSQNSLKELHQRLVKTFTSMGKTFEIIFVDDASRDGSPVALRGQPRHGQGDCPLSKSWAAGGPDERIQVLLGGSYRHDR